MPTLQERKAEISNLIKPVLEKYAHDPASSVVIRLTQQIWEVDRRMSPFSIAQIIMRGADHDGDDYFEMNFIESMMLRDDRQFDEEEANLMGDVRYLMEEWDSNTIKTPAAALFRDAVLDLCRLY